MGRSKEEGEKGKGQTKNLNHICFSLEFSEFFFVFLVGRARIFTVYSLRFVIVIFYTTEKIKTEFKHPIKNPAK